MDGPGRMSDTMEAPRRRRPSPKSDTSKRKARKSRPCNLYFSDAFRAELDRLCEIERAANRPCSKSAVLARILRQAKVLRHDGRGDWQPVVLYADALVRGTIDPMEAGKLLKVAAQGAIDRIERAMSDPVP